MVTQTVIIRKKTSTFDNITIQKPTLTFSAYLCCIMIFFFYMANNILQSHYFSSKMAKSRTVFPFGKTWDYVFYEYRSLYVFPQKLTEKQEKTHLWRTAIQ